MLNTFIDLFIKRLWDNLSAHVIRNIRLSRRCFSQLFRSNETKFPYVIVWWTVQQKSSYTSPICFHYLIPEFVEADSGLVCRKADKEFIVFRQSMTSTFEFSIEKENTVILDRCAYILGPVHEGCQAKIGIFLTPHPVMPASCPLPLAGHR